MSQIERVNKSFTDFLLTSQGSDKISTFNRYKGGHKKSISPFISGYWYLLIELPELVSQITTNTKITNLFTTDSNTKNSMIKYLHATAESFVPPSKTIQKGEVSAFGGIKKYVVLNQTVTPTFLVTFFELVGMPIQKIFKIWNNAINPNYGYRQVRLYKGRLYAFLCKPTWTAYSNTEYSIGKEDIEEMFYFEGVFPENDGNDAFQSDISDNQLVKLQIQFSYDSYYFGVEHDDILTDGIQKFRDIIGNVQFPKVEDIIPS